VSVVNNSVGIEYEIILRLDNELVRKALARALVRAKQEIPGFYDERIKHFVPWYNITNYQYPRKKGTTHNLQESFYVKSSERAMTLTAYWEADTAEDYAAYVSKDSPLANPRIRRARSPGTTLKWVSRSLPMIRQKFWQIFTEELERVGVLKGRRQPHHVFTLDEHIFASV